MSIKISELIRLVEACGKAGVKKLVHETEEGLPINLEFHENRVPEVPISTFSVPRIQQEKPIVVSPDFQKSEDYRLLEEDFDILPIQDPEKFEELLANGKLEHYGEAHA